MALDLSGKLSRARDAIDADHIVVMLSEAVSDAHLAGLRRDGVSCEFGGADAIDPARVLDTLGREFGIRRLLVAGAGALFDSDGGEDEPTPKGLLGLVSPQPREGGVMWLRCRIDRAPP